MKKAGISQGDAHRGTVPKNWLRAFQMLRDYLATLPEDEKSIVFLDEMPWMDTARSDLLAAFEWFWNGWGSMRNKMGSGTRYFASAFIGL